MMTEENNRKWGTKQPFGVPDGYFNDFDTRLKARIRAAEKKQKRNSIAPLFGVAAAAVMAVLLYVQVPGFLQDTHSEPEAAAPEYVIISLPSDDIDECELIEYIKEREIDIDIFPDSLLFAGSSDDELAALSNLD